MNYDKTKNMTQKTRIIIFANEKGGSGKSTTTMHVAIGLLQMGYRVATLDLDARQGTLTRYLANRFEYIGYSGQALLSPNHIPIDKNNSENHKDREEADREMITLAVKELSPQHDFILMDTQGADNYLSLVAHAMADIVITPMNDSFIDLDVLARIDSQTHEIKSPSVYTKIVQQTRGFRPQLRWILMRNRLSTVRSKHKNEMTYLLQKLSKEFQFELAQGFSERVTFRELFTKGLTLLDLTADKHRSLSMSELSGRQEVRTLLNHILESH
jgi:chromosome partitioning protein